MTEPSRYRFYGWRISGGLAVTTLLSYGILFYGFGVLTKPMEAEFGWSRAQTSIAFSIATLVNGLAAMPVGRIVDRYGGRELGVVGACMGSALLIAWGSLDTLAGLYVVFALLGLAWSGVFYDTAFAIIARWFRLDRTNATFLITLVAGFASTIFIPLISWLEGEYGWRDALRVLAAVLLICTLPIHAFVIRRDPTDLGLQIDGREVAGDGAADSHEVEHSVTSAVAHRSSVFWRITIAFGVARFIATLMGAHLVPLLVERGHSGAFAAGVAGSVGPMQVLGRILFLPASRRVSLVFMTVLSFGLFASGFAALAIDSSVTVVLFVILYGAANGMTTMTRAGLTATLFGPLFYGRISGTMTMVGSMLAVTAPFTAGAMRTSLGDYAWVLIGAIAVSLIAGGLVVGVGPPEK